MKTFLILPTSSFRYFQFYIYVMLRALFDVQKKSFSFWDFSENNASLYTWVTSYVFVHAHAAIAEVKRQRVLDRNVRKINFLAFIYLFCGFYQYPNRDKIGIYLLLLHIFIHKCGIIFKIFSQFFHTYSYFIFFSYKSRVQIEKAVV